MRGLVLCLLISLTPASRAAIVEGVWNEQGVSIYDLIGTTPQYREKEIERARKKVRYAFEALLQSATAEEKLDLQEKLAAVREVSSILESDSQRELYHDFLTALKIFDIPLRAGSGRAHLAIFQRFAQWLRMDDQIEPHGLALPALRKKLQQFLSEPANGFHRTFTREFLTRMWEWVDTNPQSSNLSKLKFLVYRPEVLIASTCAAALVLFSVVRTYEIPTPPKRLRDPVEQRVVEPAEQVSAEKAAEEAARAAGAAFKPDPP